MSRSIIALVADLPAEQTQAFLQWVRDYDAAHPDCHFNIRADIDMPTAQMVDMLKAITPSFELVTSVPIKDQEH